MEIFHFLFFLGPEVKENTVQLKWRKGLALTAFQRSVQMAPLKPKVNNFGVLTGLGRLY